MTIDEVADRLHVSRRSVTRWITGSILTSYSVGGRRRIAVEDLADLLARGRHHAAGPHSDAAEG